LYQQSTARVANVFERGEGWWAENRVVGLRTTSGCVAFTSELFESEKNV